MKLRLGAAGLLAAMTPLSAVTTSPPAHAGGGVDITPPEVGSCHDLTFDEYYHGKVEPDPAVDCATRHTSVTVRVRELDFLPGATRSGARSSMTSTCRA